MPIQDDRLIYYQRELAYLRNMGKLFAQTYPKVAGRLELDAEQSKDPYVERLIESFAFLTARIHRNIDDEFPEIGAALLNVLYPHFIDPVPSFSIAKFAPDPTQGKITSGHVINKNTALFANTEQGEVCRFRTCYPVTLWPLKVTHAAFESFENYDYLEGIDRAATVLRIRIESLSSFRELKIQSLRFFINGITSVSNELYELLFNQSFSIYLRSDKKDAKGKQKFVKLKEDSLETVGFELDEDILPYHKFTHPGYRLLQEYFTFPEKFLFFDLNGLEAHGAEKAFDIVILLKRRPRDKLHINEETFQLGCSPIVNLFRSTSEPIRVDQLQSEYPLVSDIRRERTTEIHSIHKVSSSSDPASETQVYKPYFSFDHEMEDRGHEAFWYARRRVSGRPGVPGSQMFLTFLDLKFNPTIPPTEAIFAHTLCTNRDLAAQLPEDAELQIEESAPLAYIACLKKPTPQINPSVDGSTLWKLISHLSLNHLSLTDNSKGLFALREILRLYSFSKRQSVDQQLIGIAEMKSRKVVRRVRNEAWRRFCQGTEITLVFDETQYMGNSPYILASVLNRFFPLYSSINSFTQLIAKSQQRDGEWKRWQPMVGEKNLL